MNIATFDLYWKKETDNHWIKMYYGLFFDWKKLKFKNKTSEKNNISKLTNKLNELDFRACHNFTWYDWKILVALESHTEKNIDTLLIDSLLNFNKAHHNLKKSYKNDTLEDAESTFKVLEYNLKTFYNFNDNIKNILYSLLINYDEYNDFFIFYNKLNWNQLKLLNEGWIIQTINNILIKKWILENKFNLNIFLKTNNWKLALSYLILFLEKQKIVLPDFIYNNNLELRKILRNNLSDFYTIFEKYFNDNIKHFLKDFYWFDWFRWNTQISWVKKSLENNDILTILSTWGWKSLIYQLPARIIWEKLGHLSLVITPLKALIKDQIDWLHNKWFNEVQYFSGDQSNLEKEIIRNKIKSWETKLLFLTPESLRNKNNFDYLKNRYISRIIVDEAHTLILWWWEFRPDYFFIKTFLEDLEKVNLNHKINITLLTATAPVDIQIGLRKYFNDRIFDIIKQDDTLKKNIKPSVINIENQKDKIELLIRKIKDIDIENNPTIIFTWKRKTSEELAKHLKEENIPSSFFHAGMFQNIKKEIQENFISWKLNLIIATKAFWMWIDKENVRYVIHYDLPWNIEDYLQEIWRAWRDWNKSQNIIFYDKKDIDTRLKQLNMSDIYNFHISNFIKNIKLDKKNKVTLSPRQIARFTWIKTTKKNYVTIIKILLSFLEREKIFIWKNILQRKYDNTYVLFNKIEEFEINKNHKEIENNNFLNENEKVLAKAIIVKIIDEKKALDLNIIEENFKDILWDDFNYRNTNINKITNVINSLKILSKWNKNEEPDLVICAGILKDGNFRERIFNIYKKRIKNIETFEESNNASFYDKIKNYYIFKNYIYEKKWKIIIKNKNIIKHFDQMHEVGEIILNYIFDSDKKYLNNQIVDINNLLKNIQKHYKQNLWLSEIREVLYFLHCLDIIKVKNWLLVLLTRFNLEFNQNIFELQEKLKEDNFKKEFEFKIKEKLDKHIQMKKDKLLSIQLLVKILEKKWVDEYNNLARYYFNHSLKDFSDNYLSLNTNKEKSYENYSLN